MSAWIDVASPDGAIAKAFAALEPDWRPVSELEARVCTRAEFTGEDVDYFDQAASDGEAFVLDTYRVEPL